MTPYTKGKRTRELLIQSAAALFLEKGYNATGVNDILSLTGLSKGSFYFYFASKKDLAINVAEYYNDTRVKEIRLTANGKIWEDFVDKLVGDSIEKAKTQRNFGCPLAVLSMEVAYLEPDISEIYYSSLKTITSIFKEVLIYSGLTEKQASDVAHEAIALYEGYSLLYRISKNIDELEKLRKDIKKVNKQ